MPQGDSEKASDYDRSLYLARTLPVYDSRRMCDFPNSPESNSIGASKKSNRPDWLQANLLARGSQLNFFGLFFKNIGAG